MAMRRRLRFWIFLLSACTIYTLLVFDFCYFFSSNVLESAAVTLGGHRRLPLECSRADLPTFDIDVLSAKHANQSSLCNDYATRRGPHQRVISISLFGPKENEIFQYSRSISFLHKLINEFNEIYSDNFILRVYHDDTISLWRVIFPIECLHPNVDFCDMSSKLFIPPKIWRFLPAADPLVDVMMSRDLDSPFTQRERAAVNAWLASNNSFHAMRDHPLHFEPMLGGMWGFRPPLDPAMSQLFYDKIHNRDLIQRYINRDDQKFLAEEIWPHAKLSIMIHDSFSCKIPFGKTAEPFPTQRPRSVNEANCFVGCIRPCCSKGKLPFGACPKECRPKDHPEWIYC